MANSSRGLLGRHRCDDGLKPQPHRGQYSVAVDNGGSAAEPALGTSVLQSCRVLSLMVSTRSCANTATMPNSARLIGGRGIDIGLGQAIDVPAMVVQLVDGLDGHRRPYQPTDQAHGR